MGIVVKTVAWLLSKVNLSLKERHMLINAVLDTLAALPLRDIIVFDQIGVLFVNGKPVGREEAALLRESAKGALSSRALTLIREQVLFKSFTFGLNSSTNFEQLYFGKAAVWWGQEEDKILKALASYGEESGELDP